MEQHLNEYLAEQNMNLNQEFSLEENNISPKFSKQHVLGSSESYEIGSSNINGEVLSLQIQQDSSVFQHLRVLINHL